MIEDVSLAMSEGEAIGLVGESGSGKSLLGLAAIGLLPAGATVTGSVRVAGHDMLRLPPAGASSVRGRIVSHIYQDALSALNPNRRIGAHFRDLWRSANLRPRDGWRPQALETLDRVALRDPDRILTMYSDQLSGGMRQRVLIALALFRRPRLLIADEPTTALDRATSEEVLELLADLQRSLGMGLLLISHDLGNVRRACDRIAVVYAGQLCEVGAARELVRSPLHRYTNGLLQSVRSLRQATYPLASIPGVVPTPTDFAPGCRFQNRCPACTIDCRLDRPLVIRGDQRAWCVNPVEAPRE